MGLNDELLTILLIFLFWFYSTSFLISFMCGPGGRLVEGPFSIDATSGIVTLVAPLDKSRLSYQLNLCCTPFASSCSCSCFLVTVVVMLLFCCCCCSSYCSCCSFWFCSCFPSCSSSCFPVFVFFAVFLFFFWFFLFLFLFSFCLFFNRFSQYSRPPVVTPMCSNADALLGRLDKSRVSYALNVTATDNGRCCGGTTSRASRGVVVFDVKDINNNAPRFTDCSSYSPTVLEKDNVGTFVIQVKQALNMMLFFALFASFCVLSVLEWSELLLAASVNDPRLCGSAFWFYYLFAIVVFSFFLILLAVYLARCS